jgi:hypothetical protein
LKSNWEIKL